MRVGIIQSNYIPWKGYFDIIGRVDLFIFYDNLQYTKNDWRNRNRIKTPRGLDWLTIPCGTNLRRRIDEVRVDLIPWQHRHWAKVEANYRTAGCWNEFRDYVSAFYLERCWTLLSDLNQAIIRAISRDIFRFDTEFSVSSDYAIAGARTDRLINLLSAVGATHYLSGPAAQAYIEPERFAAAGISLEYMDYVDYPEYQQLHGPFRHEVSVIDLLLNVGDAAPRYLLRK